MFLAGYALFGLLLKLFFPAFSSFGEEQQWFYLSFYPGNSVILFCIYRLAGAFFFGVFAGVFGIGVAVFLEDKYMLICLPFLLNYIYQQVLQKAVAGKYAAGAESAAWLESFYPASFANLSASRYWAVPALFLVLLADFPQKGGIDFFYQMRTSKRKWILGQMLFAVEASIFLTVFLVVSSMVMLLGCGKWMTGFSHAVTHYSAVFPERTGDYILQLFPENLYQQLTLAEAFGHTALLMFLYFLLLALILLLASLFNQKYAGLLADTVLIILGTVSTSVKADWMWLFPMAQSIPWVHYEKYLSKPIFPIAGSYLYLCVICAALAAASLAAARHYQAGRA